MNLKRLALVLATLLLGACGGGGGSDMGVAPAPQPVTMTPVQFNLGDDPADRLLAASLTVDSVMLMPASGAPVTVMATPRPMEVMRLMGTVAPLAIANVPQGTYTGATMAFGAATVMHMDPTTGQAMQRQVAGPMTASVTFPTPMVVGSAPMVVNLDIDMARSVAIDASGNVTMTPVLRAMTNAASGNGMDPEDGGMRGITGMVGGMGSAGGRFTLSTMQGLSGMSMGAGAGTQFTGMTGMGMMGNGLVVSVDAMPQADGTWSVSNVQWRMAAGGAMSSGVVLTTTGSPVTQVLLAMHDGVGGGMTASNLAGTTTVNIANATTFDVDPSIDLSNLPFAPVFNRAAMSKGQRVEGTSAAPMMQGGGMGGMMGGTTLTATAVRLGQQGLRGTVTAYAPTGTTATFDLALPADAALARLTGRTSVTVYQRSGTELRGATTVANGALVQVRGLLFNDGGTFRLVASRIVQ